MSEEGGSIGAYRVRETFNPSGSTIVDRIKRYTADLIDMCEDFKKFDQSTDARRGNEQARCAALAQTHYETAAMWAVKAVTTPK